MLIKILKSQFTLRELYKIFSNKIVIISYLTLTSLSIITGPFGTFENINLIYRIPYWAGVIGFCFVISIFIKQILHVKYVHSKKQNNIIIEIILSLTIAFIIALFLFGLNSLIWGDLPTLPNFASYLIITIPISLLLSVMINIFQSLQAAKPTKLTIAFLARIPKYLGNNILYISVSDHYVEATTPKGSHLILMRFSDAMKELKGIKGIQIHRSFWVNIAAIKNVAKEKEKIFLYMSDGKKLPVSRTHLAKVKQRLRL